MTDFPAVFRNVPVRSVTVVPRVADSRDYLAFVIQFIFILRSAQFILVHQKMKAFRFICWIAAWAGVVSTGDNPFNLIPPKTVDSLEIEAYIGRWYLMYTSLIPLSTYLQNGYCVTGDYYNSGNQNGKVTFDVLNSQRLDC